MGTVCGTGSLHPRPVSKEQPSRSFISPQNIFFFHTFPRTHTLTVALMQNAEKARDEHTPGEREGHKPARDELLLAVSISSKRGRTGVFCYLQIKGTK